LITDRFEIAAQRCITLFSLVHYEEWIHQGACPSVTHRLGIIEVYRDSPVSSRVLARCTSVNRIKKAKKKLQVRRHLTKAARSISRVSSTCSHCPRDRWTEAFGKPLSASRSTTILFLTQLKSALTFLVRVTNKVLQNHSGCGRYESRKNKRTVFIFIINFKRFQFNKKIQLISTINVKNCRKFRAKFLMRRNSDIVRKFNLTISLPVSINQRARDQRDEQGIKQTFSLSIVLRLFLIGCHKAIFVVILKSKFRKESFGRLP